MTEKNTYSTSHCRTLSVNARQLPSTEEIVGLTWQQDRAGILTYEHRLFLSLLNYGDIGSVLINLVHIVIPLSYIIIQICVPVNQSKLSIDVCIDGLAYLVCDGVWGQRVGYHWSKDVQVVTDWSSTACSRPAAGRAGCGCIWARENQRSLQTWTKC